MTQSAALMVQQSQKILTKCVALDKILEGGLSRGQILEISGPPGSPKEKLALKIVAAFAEFGEETLFVGEDLMMISIFPATILIKHLDCQNGASPTVIHNALKS